MKIYEKPATCTEMLNAVSKDRAYKRPFDLLLFLLAHVTLLPLWILLWVVIPIAIYANDRGPIFFQQRRVGRRGKQFDQLKFRTMIPDAEKETGPVWASPSDPRVTTVGKILRKTALDELPQVLNILRGDMSFVGPRCERPELHDKFASKIPEFDRRLAVRPGLTGLAQLHGSYDLPPDKKLIHDLNYIERQSLWLDALLIIKSILRTIFARWDERLPGNNDNSLGQ